MSFTLHPNWSQIDSPPMLASAFCSPLAEGGNVELLPPFPGISELFSDLCLDRQLTCTIPNLLPITHCHTPGTDGTSQGPQGLLRLLMSLPLLCHCA